MVKRDFIWKKGFLIGSCLIFIKIQYVVSQMGPFTTSAMHQPQTPAQVPLTLDSILKQPNEFNTFSQLGTEVPQAPQTQATDFQHLLNMMNQQSTIPSVAPSSQVQPGMDEMLRTMMMQSFGQSATPTPQQLGFSHYGPTAQTTTPLTPEQTMMNMLMQQSQGEKGSNNMMLQLYLLMNAMKSSTPPASSTASSGTPTQTAIPAVTPSPVWTTRSPTQVQTLNKNRPVMDSTSSSPMDLVKSNSSDINVNFSGLSGKLGRPDLNSINLKRLLLNRLLANNKLRLKRIRFFHENKKNRTVITAANTSSSSPTPVKSIPLQSRVASTQLDPKAATTGTLSSINPQAVNLPLASTVEISTPSNNLKPSTARSLVQRSKTNFSAKVQTTSRAAEAVTWPTPPQRPKNHVVPQFKPMVNRALPVTTPRPIVLTTAPPSLAPSVPQQLQTSSSAVPSGQKSWRYPNHPNSATKTNSHNSVNYQNPMSFQNQNPKQFQYQMGNQAPAQQNFQNVASQNQPQYNQQAVPAFQTSNGQYQNVANPNQNVANPNQNVAYPAQPVFYPAYQKQNVANQNVPYPAQHIAYPKQNVANQNVANPNQNVASPNQNVANPNQNVANPNQNVANPNQNVPYQQQNVAFPNQNVAFPNQPVAYPAQNIAYPNQNVAHPGQNVAYPGQNVQYPGQNVQYPGQNAYPNYVYQPSSGYVGYPESQYGQQPLPMQLQVPGRTSFPMPNGPLLTQVNPSSGPMIPLIPTNPPIDAAEARAEYLEQNPPTEQPPPTPTTPAPATTTFTPYYPQSHLNPHPNPNPNANPGLHLNPHPNPNPNANPGLHLNPHPNANPSLGMFKQQKSKKQWAEVLHFLSHNFPDYISLRNQVHQTALSSPMANQFRNAAAMAAKSSKVAVGSSLNQGSPWGGTTPSTTPAGEALEIEPIEVEPTQAGATTTPGPLHPLHAARAMAAKGFQIATSANGNIFGGMFGQQIQHQQQAKANPNFDIFGRATGGQNGAHGFHGAARNAGQNKQSPSFFTNGQHQGFNQAPWNDMKTQWNINGAV